MNNYLINIIKKLLRLIFPANFISLIVTYREKILLYRLKKSEITTSDLRKISYFELIELFNHKDIENTWLSYYKLIESLHLPEMTGGVNKGDQKAIFYLINHFKPKNVLEIGTHIGCSTFHIALALKSIANSHLTTVDIIDVNDNSIKRWKQFNAEYSPIELLSRIEYNTSTEFVNENSIEYLDKCEKKFDFIFLDGSHNASIVYSEVLMSLNLLNKNGIILLHDYFPNNKPLWSDKYHIPGPFLAIFRMINENNNIKIIPLGSLPWQTKLNSNITSLAILTKA